MRITPATRTAEASRSARVRRVIWLLVLGLFLGGPWSRLGAVANQKLNPTLAGGKGDISGASGLVDNPFRISPDSRRVVYLADQDTEDVFELYSVPITGRAAAGGSVTKLNGKLLAGGNVSGAAGEVDNPFRITSDSQRVVYVADQDTEDVFELYSVAIEGGPVTKLNPTLAGGRGDVRGADDEMATPFDISPDDQRVVYVADQDTDEVFELYSVPTTGGPVTQLNPPLAGGRGDIHSGGIAAPFRISPDSQRVVYIADQDFDEVFELFSVPITGGPVTQLNRTLAGGAGDVHGRIAVPFRISPDSRRVVYIADQDADEVFELYSVPITGGTVTKLNPTLAGGKGDVRGVDAHAVDPFRISPDSRRVVYIADQDADEVFELYSVAIAGGPVTKLNPTLAGGAGDVRGTASDMPHPFLVSPDSQRAVYVADQDTDEIFELYSVPIAGGPVTKLNPTLAGGKGDIRGADPRMANPFRISPDSERVVYVADQEKDSVFELFSVPITGGRSVKLNPILASGRGEIRGADNIVANPFRITPDSRRVLYLADQETVGVMELHSVPIAGGPVTRLNPTLARGHGTIVGADYEMHNPFRISPDGERAVYVADQDSDEVIELYVSNLFGINVQGSGRDIVDGETSPRAGDDTDFGSVEIATGRLSKTFTIQNTGCGLLTLGDLAVSLTGTNAADFRVTAQPAATVTAAGTTTFTVRFGPTAPGLRHATVSITHDDASPYRFVVRGRGTRDPR